jgi:riboflavin biosynthesis pyrimidine reductase
VRRVRYGVGMSLDGFIADDRDGTSWMIGDPSFDSKPFFASIDTVLVGVAHTKSCCAMGLGVCSI